MQSQADESRFKFKSNETTHYYNRGQDGQNEDAQRMEQYCHELKYVSAYCIVLFAASFTCNLVLLLTFYRYKNLKTPYNMFIIAITVVNFLGTILELPTTIISQIYCRWIFGETMCTVTGFIMYSIGCTSIYLLTALSFERFYVIKSLMGFKKLNKRYHLIIILVCFLLGFAWPVMPLFGWSYYSLEGMQTSCSVEWHEQSLNVFSYNITILITVFLLPFALMLFAHIRLIIIIKDFHAAHHKDYTFRCGGGTNKKLNAEKTLTIITMLLVAFFLVTWLPYGLVSIFRVFDYFVDPFTATLPAMFAKSSLLWTSLLFLLTNKSVRKKSIMLLLRKKETKIYRKKPVLKVKSSESASRVKRQREMSLNEVIPNKISQLKEINMEFENVKKSLSKSKDNNNDINNNSNKNDQSNHFYNRFDKEIIC